MFLRTQKVCSLFLSLRPLIFISPFISPSLLYFYPPISTLTNILFFFVFYLIFFLLFYCFSIIFLIIFLISFLLSFSSLAQGCYILNGLQEMQTGTVSQLNESLCVCFTGYSGPQCDGMWEGRGGEGRGGRQENKIKRR